jgi:hypothetical protein
MDLVITVDEELYMRFGVFVPLLVIIGFAVYFMAKEIRRLHWVQQRLSDEKDKSYDLLQQLHEMTEKHYPYGLPVKNFQTWQEMYEDEKILTESESEIAEEAFEAGQQCLPKRVCQWEKRVEGIVHVGCIDKNSREDLSPERSHCSFCGGRIERIRCIGTTSIGDIFCPDSTAKDEGDDKEDDVPF